MMIGKELMLFSVVSVVLLAGCAGEPSAPAGNGVIIKSFVPDFDPVDSGLDVTFILSVQNLGDAKAETVKAQFSGLSTEWELIPTDLGSVVIVISSLAPPDPVSGLAGEETTYEWTGPAPLKITDLTYDGSVRVYYDYETKATSLVRYVSSTYHRSVTQQGGQLAQPIGVISSTSSSGPLLVSVLARTPIVSGIGGSTGRVQINIQNVGSGRVYDLDTDGTEPVIQLDRINSIEIKGIGTGGNCAGVNADGAGTVTLSTINAQKLLRGQSKTINCVISTDEVVDQNFKNVALDINIDYKYFVDSSTSVTVLKQFQ